MPRHACSPSILAEYHCGRTIGFFIECAPNLLKPIGGNFYDYIVHREWLVEWIKYREVIVGRFTASVRIKQYPMRLYCFVQT